MKRVTVDDRRQVLVAKTEDEAYEFIAETFIEEAKKAISSRASCSICLSGGSTPLPLYERLKDPSIALSVNWSLLDLFWGDERVVPVDNPESNYGQAITYFSNPPLDQAKKHRIIADSEDLVHTTDDYEKIVRKICPNGRFDLMLLGIGEDGHTASLFPNTTALNETSRFYVVNQVPQKSTTRITATFPLIELARSLYVLAFGRSKAKILKKILFGEKNFQECPAQKLGTPTTPVCFVIDRKAAYGLGL